MENYSQYDEQQHILAAFGWSEDGIVFDEARRSKGHRFLEIGSWNPKDKSNVRALYELGWSGVCIEPSPGPLLNMLNEYAGQPRITIVSAAVGLERGLVAMMVTDDAVSSSDRKQYDTWKDITKFRGELTVPVITWADITNRWGGFQFISIDAEGQSADLFIAMLDAGLQPKCVCVELDGRLEELAAKATPLHYHLVYSNATNGVFVRK